MTVSPVPTDPRPEAQRIRETSLGWMIQTIAAAMNAAMDKELASLGLSRHQFGVLMILLEGEGVTQAEIGKRINLPGYATTRGMDALEEMGLVERRPHPTSRRAYQVFVTDAGRALAPRLFEIVARVNGAMTEGLDGAELQRLSHGLRKMSTNAKNA